MKKALLTSALLLAVAPGFAQTVSSQNSSKVPQAAEPNVTIQMKQPHIGDAAAKFGAAGVNVISDDFGLMEVMGPDLDIENRPVSEANQEVMRGFRRQSAAVGPIFVWRHRSAAEYGKTSAFASSVVTKPLIRREDGTPAGSPAHLISVTANGVRATDFAEAFTKETGWNVSMDKTLADRKIHVYLRRVSPAQALEVLALLFNASETVAIGQSKSQKTFDTQEATSGQERAARERASDALKAEIFPTLTDAQRAALASGNDVVLPMTAIPAALRPEVQDYMLTELNSIKGNISRDRPGWKPDFGTFSLQLPGNGLALGINAKGEDGYTIMF